MAIDQQGLQAAPVRLAPRRFGRINRIGLATLYRREMLRLQKDYIDSLLGPALANLLFMLLFRLAAGGEVTMVGSLPLADFVAPGLLMFAAGERAFSGACVSILFDKLEGMIADVAMAPLTAGERLVAYAGACVSSGLISAGATAAVLWPFADLAIRHPGAFIYFALAGTLMLALLGIIAGLWSQRWDHYAALLAYFLIPFSYLSGMFYSTANLPELGRQLIALNPLYYIIDGLRFGMTGVAETAVWPGALLILAFDMVLGVIVYRLFATGWRLKA
jgi:ABC-2 type transport system permease protein